MENKTEEITLEQFISELSQPVTKSYTVGNPQMTVQANTFDGQVQALSQNPIKEEVEEMIEEQHNDFYNQHIKKDMDILEKEYVNMERKAAVMDARIIRFKADHKAIFDKLEELEKEKEKALEHKDDYREVIARKLAMIGEKKWKGMEVEFTYYAPSFKNVFNKKRFEVEQPKMYAKYVDKQPVKEYIKQKLSLLPILPEDFKEEINGNESSK